MNDLASAWQILSIDTTASANNTIKKSLDGFHFLNKDMLVLQAESTAQAKHILSKHSDIALVLLNTMDEKLESLELIQYIRINLENYRARIILRTGYPDVLPDIRLIEEYEVDGYISKETLSPAHIKVASMTAIRTYHQILTTTHILRGFASSIAHEMRTPLATLRLQGEFLGRVIPEMVTTYKLAGTSKRCATPLSLSMIELSSDIPNKITHQIDRVNTVIDMILAATTADQIDSKTFKIFSVKQCVHEAVTSYPFIHGDREKLDISKLQDFLFSGSDSLLIFVIFNLLKNSLHAIAAAEKGLICIRTQLDLEFNALVFTDTGSGISSGVLPFIFNTFFTAGKAGGTGVGLAFCKSVMHAFGGSISCESELGIHTTFTLKFPVLKGKLPSSTPNA